MLFSNLRSKGLDQLGVRTSVNKAFFFNQKQNGIRKPIQERKINLMNLARQLIKPIEAHLVETYEIVVVITEKTIETRDAF